MTENTGTENKDEILDEDVRKWIDSLNDEVNISNLTNYISKGSDAVCNFLLKSAAAKIAIMDGIRKANEILKFSLNTEIEISTKEIDKYIDVVSDFEFFTLAAKSMPVNKELIDLLIKLKMNNLNQSNADKSINGNDILNTLRKHLDDIHSKVGEMPDPNIHTVRMAERKEVKPFGVKQKK